MNHKICTLNSLRILVVRNLSGREFHTLAPIKVVDFRPKFEVFLRGTTNLSTIVSLKCCKKAKWEV